MQSADYAPLALQAIDVIKPVLTGAAVKLLAEGTAAHVRSFWEWLKSQLTSARAAVIVQSIEEDPADEFGWQMLATELAGILRKNAELVAELTERLKDPRLLTVKQVSTIVGAGNDVLQKHVAGVSSDQTSTIEGASNKVRQS